MSSHLSDTLQQKYARRSVSLRKGDRVKIVRGDFVGIEGKVDEVDTSTGRVFVEGVTRESVAGTAKKVSVHASKVVVTALNVDDKRRAKTLEKPTTEREE